MNDYVILLLVVNNIQYTQKELMIMIGKKLNTIRRKRGYTLRQLANMSGLSHGFLCDIEHDRSDPSIATLRKISDALNIDPAYFLHDSNSDAGDKSETA